MIGVIFGGKSVEHDISIITALQTMNILKKNYKLFPIYVDRENRWWTGKNLEQISIYKNFHKLAKHKQKVYGVFGDGIYVKNKKMDISCVFVCMHGCFGEDGTISAVLEELNLPYTCSDVLSSSITMDKVATKDILTYNKIPNLEYYCLEKSKENNMDFPVIVKPAKLGSSVGIGVAKNQKEFAEKVGFAFEFDDKVLIEKYLGNAREFNCACFRFRDKLYLSKCSEVVKNEIFTFDDKYLNDTKQSNEIEVNLVKEIEKLTKKVYETLGCFGIVRVDFLYKDKLYVNEVNNIPGALAVYLFNERADEIFDLIIEESVRRFDKKQKRNYLFESDVLNIFEKSNCDIMCKK